MRTHTVWVAEIGGEIAGFIAYHDGFVGHIYVDLGRQGEDIGTALLGRAMADEPLLAVVLPEERRSAPLLRAAGLPRRETDRRRRQRGN